MPMTPEQIHQRRWMTLAVLCLSLVVISVDNTILNVALPSIVRDLGAEGSQLQWIIDSYTIVFAGMLLTAGALGDRFGRKKALTAGLVMFGTFSALASRSTSPEMLIIARGLMGMGGAFIFPTTLSILTNTFSGQERARAIGIWAGVAGLGIVIGPLGGGLLLEHFAWGSVFLVNVPIAAVAIVLGFFFVPDSRDPEESRLDFIGAGLSIVMLGLIMFGIIEAPDLGWGSPQVVASLTSGLALVGVFIWWELHNQHAMLDIRFFRNPRFTAASGTITLTYFALFGSTFLLTQYFQFVLGYSPLKAGAMTAPVAIGIMGFAPQAPKFVDRYGTKRVIVTGTLIVAAALCCYASNTIMSSVVGGILVRIMFGAGMGLTTAPATESIMGSLPTGKAGVGSAVNDTTRQTGGALGVAVLGSIFALRYHAIISGASGIPANISDQVKDSVGKALEAAQQLGGAQGQAVADIARNAFIESMRLVYGIAACVVLGAAFVTWKFLPARAPTEGVLFDEEVDVAEALSVTDA